MLMVQSGFPATGNILTACPPSSYLSILQSPFLPLTLTLCHPTGPPSTVSLHQLPSNTCPPPTAQQRHPPQSSPVNTPALPSLSPHHGASSYHPFPFHSSRSTNQHHQSLRHPLPRFQLSNTILHRLLLPGNTPSIPFSHVPFGPCSLVNDVTHAPLGTLWGQYRDMALSSTHLVEGAVHQLTLFPPSPLPLVLPLSLCFYPQLEKPSQDSRGILSPACIPAPPADPSHTHPGICDLELPQDVLRHVVFCHWIHHEILVAGRALRRPVLVTFFLSGRWRLWLALSRSPWAPPHPPWPPAYPAHLPQLGQHHHDG